MTLWHAYFHSIVTERPFVRLGAACILETISAGAARPFVRLAMSGSYMNRDNTKFLVLHQHETLPDGEQLLQALCDAELEPRQIDDVLEGAHKGMVMCLRMAEWALNPSGVVSLADSAAIGLDAGERVKIDAFRMDDLVMPNPG